MWSCDGCSRSCSARPKPSARRWMLFRRLGPPRTRDRGGLAGDADVRADRLARILPAAGAAAVGPLLAGRVAVPVAVDREFLRGLVRRLRTLLRRRAEQQQR